MDANDLKNYQREVGTKPRSSVTTAATRRTARTVARLRESAVELARRPCLANAKSAALATCWRGQKDARQVNELDPQTMCRECRAAFHLERAIEELEARQVVGS